jgi:hypothetical protein
MYGRANLLPYRPLGTIAGDPAEGPFQKPAPGKFWDVRTLVDDVLVMLQYECRLERQVYPETAEEAHARRCKISDGIFDLVWEEGGQWPQMCELGRLYEYADCCDLDEWCAHIRLAMAATRRGYGPDELWTMIVLRRPGAGTEPPTVAAAESGSESGTDQASGN